MTKFLSHIFPRIVCIGVWVISAQVASAQDDDMFIHGSPGAGDTQPDDRQPSVAEMDAMPTDEFGRPLSYCQVPWDFVPKSDKLAPPAKLPLLPMRDPGEP